MVLPIVQVIAVGQFPQTDLAAKPFSINLQSLFHNLASEKTSDSSNTVGSMDEWLNELPRARYWDAIDICKWEGFWCTPPMIKAAFAFKTSFQANLDDILLASPPKTGTTWLKALCLCILKKADNEDDDILLQSNPHSNVHTIESMFYATTPHPDLYTLPSPRLFHTHLPYNVLPDSIKNSDTKIVYITRNPKDTLVSFWHFYNSIFRQNQDPLPLERAVDCFCSGVHQYGPFFDNVVQYWQESEKKPEKILFLKYEDLKSDPKGEVKRLAEFLGKPFSNEEEIDNVLNRCSLERLKNLEVNRNGYVFSGVPNDSFFRKGMVGDWKNYLTPEMEEKINEITRVKFSDSGLYLD